MAITSIDHKWLLIHEFGMTQRKGTNSALLIDNTPKIYGTSHNFLLDK